MMVALGVCNGCQSADHSRHVEVIQAVPEGVYGGVRCRCTGECADGRYKRPRPEFGIEEVPGEGYARLRK